MTRLGELFYRKIYLLNLILSTHKTKKVGKKYTLKLKSFINRIIVEQTHREHYYIIVSPANIPG
jgi:hypothetical protein